MVLAAEVTVYGGKGPVGGSQGAQAVVPRPGSLAGIRSSRTSSEPLHPRCQKVLPNLRTLQNPHSSSSAALSPAPPRLSAQHLLLILNSTPPVLCSFHPLPPPWACHHSQGRTSSSLTVASKTLRVLAPDPPAGITSPLSLYIFHQTTSTHAVSHI